MLSFSWASQQEPHHYHLHDSMQNHQKKTKDNSLKKWLWPIPFRCKADKNASSVFVLAYIVLGFDWNFTGAIPASKSFSCVCVGGVPILNVQFPNMRKHKNYIPDKSIENLIYYLSEEHTKINKRKIPSAVFPDFQYKKLACIWIIVCYSNSEIAIK